MAGKIYIVDGRSFRTEVDYRYAMRDKEIIDRLRKECQGKTSAELEVIKENIVGGKQRFQTLLGTDFVDEIEEMISKQKQQEMVGIQKERGLIRKKVERKKEGEYKQVEEQDEKIINSMVQEELHKRERNRKWMISICSLVALFCICIFGNDVIENYRRQLSYHNLNDLKDQNFNTIVEEEEVLINYTTEDKKNNTKVLDEYKKLLNKNKKLIGWVKIDDTNIDYPVMQTKDNLYYLDHNLEQERDKSGSIFMDKDCDVLKPSTNFILYGHHMKNGEMFGNLDDYEKESFYKEHPLIHFDTIYEKGIYQVMYVFRSRVYSEEEIVFKYYQFIDVDSEVEFESNMKEMEKLSMYDTGVTAQYGEQLLTLSTCDYQEKNGRFVVVAKKIDT